MMIGDESLDCGKKWQGIFNLMKNAVPIYVEIIITVSYYFTSFQFGLWSNVLDSVLVSLFDECDLMVDCSNVDYHAYSDVQHQFSKFCRKCFSLFH